MNTTEKFWMVWGQAFGFPSVKHDNLAKATAEAERLARLHPGYEYIVLEAVSVSQHVTVSTRNLR